MYILELPNFNFPLKVEGRGNIKFGDELKLGTYINFGVGLNANLNGGNYNNFEKVIFVH